MFFQQLFDDDTSTFTYVLADDEAKEAVVIDPVREHLETYVSLLKDHGFSLKYVLDTHVHADHVTAAGMLRDRLGGQAGVSERAGVVCTDLPLKHKQVLRFGELELEVRATPGHTSGCSTFVLHSQKMAFTGDALLIQGSGRTDFQQGDARVLFRSVRKEIFSLPKDTTLYPGHDYKGRTKTTIAEEQATNPRLGLAVDEDAFVTIMQELNLPYPKRIDVALPLNLKCGIPEEAPLSEAKARHAKGFWEVTPEWVLQNRSEVTLIDVRELDEYEGELSHIAGAQLLPLSIVEVAMRYAERECTVVLICRSGRRSGVAALQLEALGFGDVVSMRGGMMSWTEQGLPVAIGMKKPLEADGTCG